jgi:hypothetical protein
MFINSWFNAFIKLHNSLHRCRSCQIMRTLMTCFLYKIIVFHHKIWQNITINVRIEHTGWPLVENLYTRPVLTKDFSEFPQSFRDQRRALVGAVINGRVPVPLWSPKLLLIPLEISVRTAKKTQQFTVTKTNRLTPFKEIIAVYTENRKKHINTECKLTDG